MDKASDYGYRYFDFMRRAYKTHEEKPRLGIDPGLMMALVQTEIGKAIKPKPIDKQLEKLNTFIAKALEKMLKFKVNDQERAQLNFAQSQLQNAYGSESFISVIELAMKATQRLKDS